MKMSARNRLAGTITKGANWPIGCFNRPWTGEKKSAAGDKETWGFDKALDGIKGAGYKLTGLLTRSAKEPFIGSDATPEYLTALKKIDPGSDHGAPDRFSLCIGIVKVG